MKRLIFTSIDGISYSFYYEDDILLEIDLENQARPSELEQVFVGQVKNILHNIRAAFVEYSKGKTGFLPLGDASWRDAPIKVGQELLVQVAKEAVRTKEPVLTTRISLKGMYTVVTMGDCRIGYSGKIGAERKKALKEQLDSPLLELLDSYGKQPAIGIIVRTAASDETVSAPEILKEAEGLVAKLCALSERAKSRKAFSRLLAPNSFRVRKYYHFRQLKPDEIVTDDAEAFRELEGALSEEGGSHTALRLYEDKFPLTALYSLSTRLDEAFSKKVWLKSGGFLVIEQTEALTVIDVNSGKLISGKDREAAFLKINMEAAVECARQIRLRNFNGIIIIDFINCKESDSFIRLLKSEIRKDPVKTAYIDITPLGLVELTRQKKTSPLSEKRRQETSHAIH